MKLDFEKKNRHMDAICICTELSPIIQKKTDRISSFSIAKVEEFEFH